MLAISASPRPSPPGVPVDTSSIQASSDEALQRSYLAGDRRSLQTLYLRHRVRVYRYVLRLIGDAAAAEDIASEVFLEVWRQADAFKAKSAFRPGYWVSPATKRCRRRAVRTAAR